MKMGRMWSVFCLLRTSCDMRRSIHHPGRENRFALTHLYNFSGFLYPSGFKTLESKTDGNESSLSQNHSSANSGDSSLFSAEHTDKSRLYGILDGWRRFTLKQVYTATASPCFQVHWSHLWLVGHLLIPNALLGH